MYFTLETKNYIFSQEFSVFFVGFTIICTMDYKFTIIHYFFLQTCARCIWMAALLVKRDAKRHKPLTAFWAEENKQNYYSRKQTALS